MCVGGDKIPADMELDPSAIDALLFGLDGTLRIRTTRG
jgi:hypothetical protein